MTRFEDPLYMLKEKVCRDWWSNMYGAPDDVIAIYLGICL